MTKKEILRYDIIRKLIEGKINSSEATKQINLTVRQTKKLKRELKNAEHPWKRNFAFSNNLKVEKTET